MLDFASSICIQLIRFKYDWTGIQEWIFTKQEIQKIMKIKSGFSEFIQKKIIMKQANPVLNWKSG